MTTKFRVRHSTDEEFSDTQTKKNRVENQVAIDFGASKTTVTKEGYNPEKYVDSTFCVTSIDNKIKVTTLEAAEDELDEEKVVRHFKHKMGLSLESGSSSRPKLFINHYTTVGERTQYSVETSRSAIEDIFYQIIKSILSEQAQFLFGSEKKIPKSQVFLVSYPNTDSIIQKIHFTKLWRKTLMRNYLSSGWNGETDGKLHLYSEGECALFSLMEEEELDESWLLPTVIIDQGDSTTNVCVCLVTKNKDKTKIALRSSGIRLGGADYTARLSRHLPTDDTATRSQHRFFLESKAEALKDRLINKKQDKASNLPPFKGNAIISSEYRNEIKELDKQIVDFVNGHVVGKVVWKRVILTGGAMRNTQLQEAIRKGCFNDVEEQNFVVKSERMRVCNGLFTRHRMNEDPQYIIEEASPHSFYVLIADGSNGFTLFRILKKFKHEETIDIFPLVANGNLIQFPVFQVNSKTKQIKLTDQNKDILLQRVGDLSFPTQGIKSDRFEPRLQTKYKRGELECHLANNNKKCNFTFDWEEILEQQENDSDVMKTWNMQPHTYQETVEQVKKVYQAAQSDGELSSDDHEDSQDSF